MKQFALFSTLIVAAFIAVGVIAEARQAEKIPVIGYLSADEGVERRFFRKGLLELGYVKGQISVIYYFAIRRPDRLPMLAAQMINNHKVDVIVTTATLAAQAAKKATTTIPIVVVAGTDLVRTGLVESLARPGGNVTGITMFDEELAGKQLELLKETVPTVSRVGVLWNSDSATGLPIFKQIEATARALGVTLHSMEMRTTKLSPECSVLFIGPECPDFDSAFKAAIQRQVGAFMVAANTFPYSPQSTHILELVAKTKLPAIYNRNEWVSKEGGGRGGLMFYGSSPYRVGENSIKERLSTREN